MKKISCLVAGLALGGLLLPLNAIAAKTDGPKAKIMAQYDKNGNGQLDADEMAAIRKDFAAAPEGELKRFDTDKDGKLSDEEIARMVPGSGKKGGDKKADKGKKAEAEKTPEPAKEKTPEPAKVPTP